MEVEEGGSAQQAGLQPGDVITELDGEDVQLWSLEEVVSRAQAAAKVPPSLVVMSRIRHFRLPRGLEGGFGITLRGNAPVFVRSVDFDSAARQAGVRSGDLLLELNRERVRYASKIEVLERLKRTGKTLSMVVIASGLDYSPLPPSPHAPSPPSLPSHRHTSHHHKHHKALEFHNKVRYYLLDDAVKMAHVRTLLRLYAQDRSVGSLASSLDVLLEGPIERRILPYIRDFLLPQHRARFDSILSITPVPGPAPPRRASVDVPRTLRDTRHSPCASSMPSLTALEGRERLVRVARGGGGFGFSLSGNAPVFIRSVDPSGAATSAGLRAGDRLLALNGLNIRNATHSHVVRLLKGSGTTPSLLVSSPSPRSTVVPPTTWSRRGSVSSEKEEGRGVGEEERRGMVVGGRKVSGAFREKMAEVLRPQEREQVVQCLGRYSQQRDLPTLIKGLHGVLGDPVKMVLFHYVCQLLPEETQGEFDRLAAARLAGTEGERSGEAGAGVVSYQLYSMEPRGEGLLEDTPIGPVVGSWLGSKGQAEGSGRALSAVDEEKEEEEEEWGVGKVRERMVPAEREVLRVKRESLEKTPVGQTLSVMLAGEPATPQHRCSSKATHPATPTSSTADMTAASTPGLIPPPPPTPEIGPGGIPVPPPPPPSLPSSSSSQSHLKRVNWKKMPKTEGTVWGELSSLEEAVELAELEQQFGVQKAKGPGPTRDKKPSIMDPKKAYNISILLAHLKLPIPAIKEAVLSCDGSVLAEQHLCQLEAYAPDKKECLGFARYYNNPTILNLPDRFSCEMSTIPCYRQRLHALVFRTHYHDKLEEIKPDLEAICLASVQLQRSKHLKKILELVLAIGNQMNMGNTRVGAAQGFQVGFLSQLRGLRTSDGRSSLLHFLAGLAERKFPHALKFPDDLSFCNKAARVSGQTLEVEVSELSQGLKDIRRDIRDISSSDPLPGDRFEMVMKEFLSTAEEQMSDLLQLYSRMKQEYSQAARFFGEDPIKTRIDDFFGIFASFSTDFERAVRENRQAREEAAARERRQEEQEGTTRRRGKVARGNRRQEEREAFEEFKEELTRQQLKPTSSRPHFSPNSRPGPTTDFRHLLRPQRERPSHPPSSHSHPPSSHSPSSPEFDDETHF